MPSITHDLAASAARNLHVAVTGIPAVNEAGAHYDQLRAELLTTGRALREIKGSRKAAEQSDARLYGRAISEGKPDPGPVSTIRVDREATDLARRVAALEVAVTDAAAHYQSVLRTHREALVNAALDRLDAARERQIELLDALAAAWTERQASEYHLAWCQKGPGTPRPKYELGGPVPDLTDRAGRVMRVDDIVAALRAAADPPPPPPPPPEV